MKEIKTNGITILLVEVPEDAKNFTITEFDWFENAPKWYLLHETIEDNCGCPIEFDGDWEILGKSTELSEEQMKEILPIYEGAIRGYRIYTQRPDLLTKDIQESYLSLLEANGIVDRNSASHPSDIDPTNRSHYDKIEQEWQQAQSKVKHYLVLKRI